MSNIFFKLTAWHYFLQYKTPNIETFYLGVPSTPQTHAYGLQLCSEENSNLITIVVMTSVITMNQETRDEGLEALAC